MILHIHSDASNLSVSHACSRLGVLFYCGDKPPHDDKLNGSILNAATVIKNVIASAAESEVGACFQNSQSGAPLIVTLIELGHQQPATPLRTYNSTAFGILNETIKQNRSIAMDMRYHWLTDRVRQKQCNVYWRPSKENLGDYHTKHHAAQHHKYMLPLILQQANILNVLRGCVKLQQPQPCTDTQTGQCALRATQVRAALSHAYATTYQNRTKHRTKMVGKRF
jgi:hypothetical protein